MKTTNLFVELIVIGTGALFCLMLIFFGRFQIPLADSLEWAKITMLVPLLSVTYVLGIIVDRMSDEIFSHFWRPTIKRENFNSESDFYTHSNLIATVENKIADQLEYSRSKMRICRGWTLNCILITGSFVYFFLPTQESITPHTTTMFTAVFTGTFLSLLCWLTWYSIAKSYYSKIRRIGDYIKSNQIPLIENDDSRLKQ